LKFSKARIGFQKRKSAARTGAAKAYAVDVSNYADVQRIGEQILSNFERVNILVNNAGVTRDMLSMAMSPEDWDVVLKTNLKGAFNFVQAVQRSMIKQRHGRIINISSVIGLRMRSPLATSPLIRPARYRKKFQSRFRNEFHSSAWELRRTLRRQWLCGVVRSKLHHRSSALRGRRNSSVISSF